MHYSLKVLRNTTFYFQIHVITCGIFTSFPLTLILFRILFLQKSPTKSSHTTHYTQDKQHSTQTAKYRAEGAKPKSQMFKKAIFGL